MLGIQINGEFLDLPPGTIMQLQKENPFLQFDDTLLGEYSLPFSALPTEKNNRLLNYAAIAQQRITNSGIDALLFDKAIQAGVGKIKIERASINLNRSSRGLISCYYLSGTSGFWQDIKEMKMRDVVMGGDRSFDWDGLITDTGTGFWRHIHQVAAGAIAAYDYAFYPVQNQGWPEGDVNPPIMNMMYYDVTQTFPVRFPTTYVPLEVRERNRIVPFPYLKYVLLKVIEHTGWTITGDILDDADFIKITMINFRAIDWCHVTVTGGVATSVPRDPVVFNLKDHMPDITVSAFLIALKNRFGWWYDFDNASKKITIRTLSSLVDGQPTDMTGNSSAVVLKEIVQDKPIYALRNNFAVSSGEGAPNFAVIDLQGDVDKIVDLPAAAEALYGQVYLVVEENNYYICQQNDDEDWVWTLYTYNIHDYEPEGNNADIRTDATLVGNEYYSEYMDLIPRIDNQGEWNGRTDEPASWGIHLCFYYGQRDNKSGDPIPFASHHIYDSNGFTLAAWSLAFKARTTAGDEVGLYDLNWKAFLDMISGKESVDVTLYLPMHSYLRLRFSDRIVINGVMLFIKQARPTIPYNGEVICSTVRVQ